MNLLDEIFTHKRAEIARSKADRPLADVQAAARQATPALDFLAAVRAPLRMDPGRRPVISIEAGKNSPAAAGPDSLPQAASRPALIAEIKRRSPSRGPLALHLDPAGLARIYRQNGAAAISVLTDSAYFDGSLDHLQALAAQAPRLPLLRKDFLCDPYQVYESRAAGADAILLIAASLGPGLLQDLHGLALSLGMTPLVEVHSLEEIEKILPCNPALVGINNRDLRDFSVRLETTFRLRPYLPPGIAVVAESGINTAADVARLAEAGVDAILVGEALVTASDIAGKVRELSAGAPVLLDSPQSSVPEGPLSGYAHSVGPELPVASSFGDRDEGPPA